MHTILHPLPLSPELANSIMVFAAIAPPGLDVVGGDMIGLIHPVESINIAG